MLVEQSGRSGAAGPQRWGEVEATGLCDQKEGRAEEERDAEESGT